MFTGIIEEVGEVINIVAEKANLHFFVKCKFIDEIKIDESIAHNGVCLTVVNMDSIKNVYQVTAIHETLLLTNLQYIEKGNFINLERAMLPQRRIDGHFVQGHVDSVTKCIDVTDANGSWYYTFLVPIGKAHLIVQKGSITINGVSLTAILDQNNDAIFKVAIIPYTYENTNFKFIHPGTNVNLEFDILGKYISRMVECRMILDNG